MHSTVLAIFEMEPSIDKPKTLLKKQPLETERHDMVDTPILLHPAVQTSSRQESQGISSLLPTLSDSGKDPEKGLPQTIIENKYSDKTESENEVDADPDLVSGRISGFTGHAD